MRVAERWTEYVYGRLDRLKSDADKEGNKSYPNSATVDLARRLAETLFDQNTPTPSVVPGESGGDCLCSAQGDIDVEIEVGSEETTLWAFAQKQGWSANGLLRDKSPLAKSILRYLARL